MSNSDYNKWKIELENNIKNQPQTPPRTAEENINYNLLINRRNYLINLIKVYDDHKLRESLCYTNPDLCSFDGSQQEFNFSHSLREDLHDDFNLSPSNDNPNYYNHNDPYNAAALSSPRKNEKIGGKVKVYTGPKNGKYIIKNGAKVYIDSKSLSNNVQYIKKAKSKKK
jgi:hypothetical protein